MMIVKKRPRMFLAVLQHLYLMGAVQMWVTGWDKCIAVQGDSVEKWQHFLISHENKVCDSMSSYF